MHLTQKIKKHEAELKVEIDKYTVIIEDFNTPHSAIERGIRKSMSLQKN